MKTLNEKHTIDRSSGVGQGQYVLQALPPQLIPIDHLNHEAHGNALGICDVMQSPSNVDERSRGINYTVLTNMKKKIVTNCPLHTHAVPQSFISLKSIFECCCNCNIINDS